MAEYNILDSFYPDPTPIGFDLWELSKLEELSRSADRRIEALKELKDVFGVLEEQPPHTITNINNLIDDHVDGVITLQELVLAVDSAINNSFEESEEMEVDVVEPAYHVKRVLDITEQENRWIEVLVIDE